LVGSEFKAQNPTGGKFDKTVSVNPRPLRPPPECRFSRPRHRAADGAITPLEGQAIAVIAAEIGEATYRKLFARADESFWDQAALKEFLASIERPEARSLIYESILALAAADSISEEERMMPAPPPQWQMSVG
jgi:hypothetical protein